MRKFKKKASRKNGTLNKRRRLIRAENKREHEQYLIERRAELEALGWHPTDIKLALYYGY